MNVYAVSKKDGGQWHRAKVVGIHYQSGLSKDGAGSEYDEDEDYEDEGKIVRKLQVAFEEGKGESYQEYVGLEDVLFINKEDEKQQR